MVKSPEKVFRSDCSSRPIIDTIVDKWSMMIIAVLDCGPQRFSGLKRTMEGVTQKALTQALRRLERSGLITRRVLPTSPVSVEYSITALGRTLQPPFGALYAWAVQHRQAIEEAQRTFDARALETEDGDQ
jgi:DNA-binding HxlR family transcriptional regulator